ncbi:MAG: acylphosphatase [Asgard group archaeon]|nr:acylphosphatase [Asgard group archaeon]
MSEIKSRASFLIKGQVQGVFFRVNAKEMASSLSITGWIKNNPDGSVSGVAEGPKDLVSKFLDWCKRGPSQAEVSALDFNWEEYKGEFSHFEIKN